MFWRLPPEGGAQPSQHIEHIESRPIAKPTAQRSAPRWLLKRCHRVHQGPIIGHCAICLRFDFAKLSQVVLIVVRTVIGQMVTIGLISRRISRALRIESQAKEIKQLAVKKMRGSGIG